MTKTKQHDPTLLLTITIVWLHTVQSSAAKTLNSLIIQQAPVTSRAPRDASSHRDGRSALGQALPHLAPRLSRLTTSPWCAAAPSLHVVQQCKQNAVWCRRELTRRQAVKCLSGWASSHVPTRNGNVKQERNGTTLTVFFSERIMFFSYNKST
jgi:hypothetical protein